MTIIKDTLLRPPFVLRITLASLAFLQDAREPRLFFTLLERDGKNLLFLVILAQSPKFPLLPSIHLASLFLPLTRIFRPTILVPGNPFYHYTADALFSLSTLSAFLLFSAVGLATLPCIPFVLLLFVLHPRAYGKFPLFFHPPFSVLFQFTLRGARRR